MYKIQSLPTDIIKIIFHKLFEAESTNHFIIKSVCRKWRKISKKIPKDPKINGLSFDYFIDNKYVNILVWFLNKHRKNSNKYIIYGNNEYEYYAIKLAELGDKRLVRMVIISDNKAKSKSVLDKFHIGSCIYENRADVIYVKNNNYDCFVEFTKNDYYKKYENNKYFNDHTENLSRIAANNNYYEILDHMIKLKLKIDYEWIFDLALRNRDKKLTDLVIKYKGYTHVLITFT